MSSTAVPSTLRRSALTLACAFLAGACDDGTPTALETPPQLTRNPRAAELQLYVTLADTASGPHLWFQGALIPGRNAVTDDRLEILGQSFAGRGPYAEGYREYGGMIEAVDPEAFHRPIEIAAPTVAGVSPTRPVIQLAPLAREGEARFETERGALPTVEITAPVAPPPAAVRVEWAVDVRPEGGPVRTIFGVGVPPRRIPIPRLLLPNGVQEPTVITLRYVVAPDYFALPDGAYRVPVFFTVAIDWTVTPRPGS